MQDLFRRFSVACANAFGSSWTFFLAVLIIGVRIISGPRFPYKERVCEKLGPRGTDVFE